MPNRGGCACFYEREQLSSAPAPSELGTRRVSAELAASDISQVPPGRWGELGGRERRAERWAEKGDAGWGRGDRGAGGWGWGKKPRRAAGTRRGAASGAGTAGSALLGSARNRGPGRRVP